MDYRCPVCRNNIVKRRLSQTVLVGLEIECPHCKSVVRHNVHRVEAWIIMANFAALLILGLLAYWLQSTDLVVVVIVVAMMGAALLPLLEHTYLRNWPRYASIAPKPDA